METQKSGFENRVKQFNGELEKLQNKLAVKIYAANCVLKNGEVLPLIRVTDNLQIEFVGDKKVDEHKTKARNPVSSKK